MDINYLTDTFNLFHFVANLSSAYKLPIDGTNQKKVIPVTWWWKAAWLQYIKIGYTRSIILLVESKVFIILAIAANTINKTIILKKLVVLISVVCLAG